MDPAENHDLKPEINRLRYSSNDSLLILGASTMVAALHASFYNIDAIVTEEFEAFLDNSEIV